MSICFQVVRTEGLVLPGVFKAVLGAQPERFLGTCFNAEGYVTRDCFLLTTVLSTVSGLNMSVLTSSQAASPKSLNYLLIELSICFCESVTGTRGSAMLFGWIPPKYRTLLQTSWQRQGIPCHSYLRTGSELSVVIGWAGNLMRS